MRKNPWIAAVANALLPGLGYLYLGSKRKFFAIGLTVGMLVGYLSPTLWRIEIDIPIVISSIILLVVFAVDAWKDAKKLA